jgi:hypothetical protein
VAPTLHGTLHVDVAFDLGDEVDLNRAQKLVPGEFHTLPGRGRAPSPVAYRPSPLRFRLPPVGLELAEIGPAAADAEATVFDFGGASVALHVPFRLGADALTRMAATLADPQPIVAAARSALIPLHDQLAPAIVRPALSDLVEEYFVFQLLPGSGLPPIEELRARHREWIAALIRLECEPLSADELAESLRVQWSYTPGDLAVFEWSAALLVDRECRDVLEMIEFANLQLLEFRVIDVRLQDKLGAAYELIHPLSRSSLPFWRTHMRPLRDLLDMRNEANAVFQRTTNVLKLVGDQYLARLYQALNTRLHLKDWSDSIRHNLDVAERTHEMLYSQGATYRTELLEVIIVLLIAFEIVMAFVR